MATRAKTKSRAKSKAKAKSKGRSTRAATSKSATRRAAPKRKTAAPKRGAATKRRATPKRGAAAKRASGLSPRNRSGMARTARMMGEQVSEQKVPADALALLEQDHREVEAFYKQFEQADSSSEKSELAWKICVALTVHAEIEEEILYPKARRAIEETDLLDEAEVEHMSAKQLIAEISAMSPRDKLFDAKVKVLVEYVKHHVKEEENELFPKLRDSGLDLHAMGRKLAARKIELLAQLSGRA